jgi:hypothetical protein
MSSSTSRRLSRSMKGAVTGAVLMLSTGAFAAGGPPDVKPDRGGKGPPREAAAPCNYYYQWLGKMRFPLQSDPHASYSFVAPASQAALDGVGFLVRGQFIHGVWTSWLTYRGPNAQPFSGANFVNNSPENSYDPVVPDSGSIDPFTPGQPMLGAPRNFTLLFMPADYRGSVAASLDGTTTADIAEANTKPYPPAKDGDFWVLANRNYQALPGYNPGGTTKDTFPVVTAVDLASGRAVDCQQYNVLPESLQRPPDDPPEELSYGRVPVRFALKNGTKFTLIGALGGGGQAEFAPENPPGLVQFTRSPVGPGADVPTIPPGNCAGYLGTRTSTHLVSLIRIPHIANYTNHQGVTGETTYPNPVDPSRPWEAAYISFSLYGTSASLYLPGDPRTNSVAGAEFKADATGGSTILIWPRTMSRRDQRRVFDYADAQGWAIVRGGTEGREASANVLFRIKGAASDYYGADSNVPCFFDEPQNKHKRWDDVPVDDGSPWVATAANLGAAAPQGVTCSSIDALTSGRCLGHLKEHIRATGGSYEAP